MTISTIRVEGLRELQRELRAVDKALPRELRQASKEAGELVRRSAQGKASTRMEQSAAGRLKVLASQRDARIRLGGKPYDLGAEFGAARNQPRLRKSGRYTGLNQFRPWRGSGSDAGYFLYPAIRDEQDGIIEVYGNAVDRLIGRAFPQGGA